MIAKITNKDSFYFGQVGEAKKNVGARYYNWLVWVKSSGGFSGFVPFNETELEFIKESEQHV